MKRYIIPLMTILSAVLIYGVSMGYDHYLTKMSKQNVIPTPQNTPDIQDKATIVPVFKFKTLNGQNFNIKDFRGSVVILNFWATWCAPCVIEFPDLLDIVDQYDGKVILIALSSDLTQAPVDQFLMSQAQKRGKPLNSPSIFIAMDPGRKITRDLFQITTYPESFIIDPNGQIVRHIIGIEDWTKVETQNLIKNLVHNGKSN